MKEKDYNNKSKTEVIMYDFEIFDRARYTIKMNDDVVYETNRCK